jgi:hypothetical protein
MSTQPVGPANNSNTFGYTASEVQVRDQYNNAVHCLGIVVTGVVTTGRLDFQVEQF